MRRFSMYRRGDESGVSVLGRVLDGVVFHTGQVVVCWRTDLDATQGKGRGRSSLGIYAARTPSQAPARALSKGTGASWVGGEAVHSTHLQGAWVSARGIEACPRLAQPGICGGSGRPDCARMASAALPSRGRSGCGAPLLPLLDSLDLSPEPPLCQAGPSRPRQLRRSPLVPLASASCARPWNHRLRLLPPVNVLPRHALVHGDRGHAEGQGVHRAGPVERVSERLA